MVYIFDPESGYLLSEKHLRVAERIKEYDPHLELAWIPPDKRSSDEPQLDTFCIIDRRDPGNPYVVRRLVEDEVDERLIGWLWQNDMARQNPKDVLAKLDAEVEREKRDREKRNAEIREEARDKANTILRSPLHTFKHEGVTYRD